jgi:actin related protein 2/3 complex subunit 1A/1B
MIVTCGHDRNAYVWKFEEKEDQWKPTLVILRINRAATAVKWSPAGNKFAVASGAKCVPVCHFEESNDWWISKMIKKNIKSTVLSLAWCVNNKFVIAGSCDFKCRVYSAYIEGIDPAEDDGFGDVFPKQHEFGEILAEFDHARAWVQAVAWAPSGFRLAFAGHGSTLHFVQLLGGGSAPIVQTVTLPGLPYLDIAFLGDSTLVAVGFDANPALYVAGGADSEPTWGFTDVVDKKDEKKEEAKVPAKGANFGAARAMFAKAADQGGSAGAKTATLPVVETIHKNNISSVNVFAPAEGNATTFSTSGLDGRVVFWDLSKRSHLNLKALKLVA